MAPLHIMANVIPCSNSAGRTHTGDVRREYHAMRMTSAARAMYIMATDPSFSSSVDENQKATTSDEHETANMRPNSDLSPPREDTCNRT
jgi:hypothetical protein